MSSLALTTGDKSRITVMSRAASATGYVCRDNNDLTLPHVSIKQVQTMYKFSSLKPSHH